MVEITTRTVQSRLLLRPSRLIRDIMVGAIGRAQLMYDMEIHAAAALSNHYHLLVSPRSPAQLCRFMTHVNSKLAKETGRLHDWPEKFWGRRYQPIVVSDEEAAQVGRLAYVLAHGCKEGFVDDPLEWPGMQCARHLLTDQPMTGLWFDRTAEYRAKRYGRSSDPTSFVTVETIRFSPLPCWRGASADWIRQRIKEIVEWIVAEARVSRRSSDRDRMGIESVQYQDPHQRPRRSKRGPAPLIHAASQEKRQEFLDAYREFARSKR